MGKTTYGQQDSHLNYGRIATKYRPKKEHALPYRAEDDYEKENDCKRLQNKSSISSDVFVVLHDLLVSLQPSSQLVGVANKQEGNEEM
eukprot:3392591-Pleurochrysis_carterae.AAC.4